MENVDSLKLLGVSFSDTATTTSHICSKAATAGKLVGMLRRQSDFLSEEARFRIYVTTIRPVMEYGSPVYGNAAKYSLAALDRIQRRAMRLFPSYRLDPLSLRRDVGALCQLYQILAKDCPPLVSDHIQPVIQQFARQTRHAETSHSRTLTLGKSKTERHQNSFLPATSRLWNRLSESTVCSVSCSRFKLCACRELRSWQPPNSYDS